MIQSYEVWLQTLLATLFTWGLTALGASMVFFFNGFKRSFLDGSLGFAAGIMTAASVWSLLIPAIELCEESNAFGSKRLACIPVSIGIVLGAFFVYLTDKFLPNDYIDSIKVKDNFKGNHTKSFGESYVIEEAHDSNQLVRNRQGSSLNKEISIEYDEHDKNIRKVSHESFRRIFLLIFAVTVHNIPEGLAVGVGFGAIGSAASATFDSARNLAIGIGLQNFPEGLAVSLPLYASGFSRWKSFWYGQISGMVEPFAGLFGAITVNLSRPILPYTLSFAAGAMIYVVFENIIPEATSHGNSKLATWCCIFGFCFMLCLDVGLA